MKWRNDPEEDEARDAREFTEGRRKMREERERGEDAHYLGLWGCALPVVLALIVAMLIMGGV